MNAVARFTTMMESADLSPLMEFGDGGHRSPTIADFTSAKQDLYDAIGDLVIASQEITADEKEVKDDPSTPPKNRRKRGTEGVRKVIKAGESLKTKVHSVCLNVSFMVEEDKIRRRKSSGQDTTPSFMTVSTHGRYLACTSLIDFSFASQDTSPRPRPQVRDPSSKVKKIFGDDAPSPPIIQKPPSINQTQDTAWFLKHDLEDDLAYDVKGQVKGGTLDALIERLTRHDMMDSTFNQTFLLTFKSFTTQEEFFEKLIARYPPLPPFELI
jgi:son of sevenless